MIKFFRKIRYDLLEKNKTGKYLKYAIGEIALVVIGILIALQINNYNIQKQNEKIEQIYLLALQNEFKNNIKLLDSTISHNKKVIKGTVKLLSFFDSKVFDTLSQKTVSLNMAKATAEETYFNPSTGVLTEIISSGNLKLFKNQELKQKLASFGNTLEMLKHQEKEVLRHGHNIEELRASGGNIGKMFSDTGSSFEWKSRFAKASNLDLFKSKLFENRLFLFLGSSSGTDFYFYQPMKKEIKSILKIIENEIKD